MPLVYPGRQPIDSQHASRPADHQIEHEAERAMNSKRGSATLYGRSETHTGNGPQVAFLKSSPALPDRKKPKPGRGLL
jgi:hypothetical protein